MQNDKRREERAAGDPKRKRGATEPPHMSAISLAVLLAAGGLGSQLARDGFLDVHLLALIASFALFALLVYAAALIAFAAAGAMGALRRAPLTRAGSLAAALFSGAAATSLYPLARAALSLPASQAALAPTAPGEASLVKLLFLLLLGAVVIFTVGIAISWRCGADLGGLRFAYLLSRNAFVQMGRGPLRDAVQMAKDDDAKAAKGLPWQLTASES